MALRCNPHVAVAVRMGMRRPGGIVPPGKAGLIMLAFALIPIVLKEAKPLVRAAGRGLRKLGEAVEKVAESSQIDAKPESNSAASSTDEPEAKSMSDDNEKPKAKSKKKQDT